MLCFACATLCMRHFYRLMLAIKYLRVCNMSQKYWRSFLCFFIQFLSFSLINHIIYCAFALLFLWFFVFTVRIRHILYSAKHNVLHHRNRLSVDMPAFQCMLLFVHFWLCICLIKTKKNSEPVFYFNESLLQLENVVSWLMQTGTY